MHHASRITHHASRITHHAPRITHHAPPLLMHHFYLSPERCDDSTLTLTGPEAHHALRVLRIRQGESVTVLDGQGHVCACEVAEPARNTVSLKVVRKEFVEPLPYRLTLLQAVPKGKMFDAIVQKATELGAFRVVPLLTGRVVAQLDEERAESKLEHWRAVAIESIKQCGSPWLPRIEAPVSLSDFLARAEALDLSLIASLQPGSRHPREWFRAFVEQHGRRPALIGVWVGPEGDFAPGEIDDIKAAGGLPVTLGPRVLRCETAATYCLSIVNYEMQSAGA
jgi:16S rRNA (uracil1498-N3)-methyltransferase